MTIRDIAVAFGFEVDRNSERQAENSIRGVKNLATKLLGAIGIGFSIAGISALAEAAAEADALKSQFTQVFGDMEDDAAGRLKAIADDTGVAVNRMKGSFTQIAAFSKTTGLDQAQSLEVADRAMKTVADSAAFYDRSIEAVTESMRSFLKGNFENDAALGLSCTETTRNAAANALYGKSFKDLSEAEKQFTLLQMVEDANKASGAIGQAARESDTWTNQLGNLKQSITDLKVAAGSGFLKPAVEALKWLNGLVQKCTAAVQEMTGENGVLTRSFGMLHALVKRLQPAMDRMGQALSKGMSKGRETVKKVVDKLGGLENVLKIAGVAAAAFIAVLAVSKVVAFMKSAGGLAGIVSKLSKAFSIANLKVMAIIAAVTLIALVIEDFVNFMMGNDSVIGTMFDKAGIGADNAREAILGVFDSLKGAWDAALEALSAVWDALREAGEAVFNALATVIGTVFGWIEAFWSSWGGRVLSWFGVLWNSFIGILNGFLGVITGIANFITAVFTGNWQGAWEAVKQIFANVWDIMTNILAAAWDTVKMLFDIGLAAVNAVWTSLWTGISSFFQGIWNGILSFLDGIVGGIASKVADINNGIINGIRKAVDWIKGLPKEALQWGADIIGGIVDGIKGAIGKVGEAAKGIADKIKSFLHFSVPDEGPLTDYESWMPDFMGGLAKGISDNKDAVLDKVKELAGGISALSQAATVRPATAAAGTVNSMASNVTQNVNIDNTYSGGTAEAQKAVSRTMRKSATDATTQMARALAYARG